MSNAANSPAAELRGAGQKELTLPGTETNIIIRKVHLWELFQLEILPTLRTESDTPDEKDLSRADQFRQEAQEKPKPDDDWSWAKEVRLRFTIIELGMVEPHFYQGDPQHTPEDAVHYSDISKHLDWLVAEILAWSSIGEGTLNLRPFSEGSAGSEGGQAGAEVRKAPE